MKKSLIAISMLAAFTAQSAPAFAACADLYNEAALKRDKIQDIAFAGGVFAVTAPAAIITAGAGHPLLGLIQLGADAYLGYHVATTEVGHLILPNRLEQVQSILEHKPYQSVNTENDVLRFHNSVKRSYYRVIGKAITKGRVPSDTQPLSAEEIDVRVARILEDAESKNLFCPVVGKKKDGSDKHALFARVAIRDYVLAKILADDGVELHNLSTILREAKEDAVEGIEKGFDATKEALKKLFRKKDRQAQEGASDAQLKSVTTERDTTRVVLPNVVSQSAK